MVGSMIARRVGFTIIEVVLFLGITGLLLGAVLVTAGINIAVQRYQDSVATLQSDIQQQFEDVIAVQNDRTAVGSGDARCGTDGGRGTSECIIMGKFMTITSTGNIRQYKVYGVRTASAPAPTDEYLLLREYNPTTLLPTVVQSRTEWDTRIAAPTTGRGSANVGILILRSPASGNVYTFVNNNVATGTAQLQAMITQANTQKYTLCINPNGLRVAQVMGISIAANASSANAVEFRTNGLMQASGEGVQC